MKLDKLTSLTVEIGSPRFLKQVQKLKLLTENIKGQASSMGATSDATVRAVAQVLAGLNGGISLQVLLDQRIKVRALSSILLSENAHLIVLTPSIFSKIHMLTPRPSIMLLESVQRYFFHQYQKLINENKLKYVADWIRWAATERGINKPHDKDLYCANGASWVAATAVKGSADFERHVDILALRRYSGTQFMVAAKNIYYIKQLKIIPTTENHPLLSELNNTKVFNSKYAGGMLLGHEVLRILIDRSGVVIHEKWQELIISIAGDPRVSKTHGRYRKWWSQLSGRQILKVRGWLDLKLFLSALKDYSESSGDPAIQRMFPERKQYLEGLFEKELVQETKLYLSQQAESYILENYDESEIPNFYRVSGNPASLIYLDIGSAKIIEGSHSCQLWVYEDIHQDTKLYDYSNAAVSYRALTMDLNSQNMRLGMKRAESIVHSRSNNYIWQSKSVTALKKLGVDIEIKDVLSSVDFTDYKNKGNSVFL